MSLNRIRTVLVLPDGSHVKVNEALDGSQQRVIYLYRPVESLAPNESMEAVRGFRRAAGKGLDMVEAIQGRRVAARRGGGGAVMDDGEEVEPGALVLARELSEAEFEQMQGGADPGPGPGRRP